MTYQTNTKDILSLLVTVPCAMSRKPVTLDSHNHIHFNFRVCASSILPWPFLQSIASLLIPCISIRVYSSGKKTSRLNKRFMGLEFY